jgi:hypothetical protein
MAEKAEVIETSNAFKSGLKELDAKARKAHGDLEIYLIGGANALGVPSGWSLNPRTMNFEPTKKEVEAEVK